MSEKISLNKNINSFGYTILSGMGMGVDTIAHATAVESSGNVIAVLGAPIHQAVFNGQLQAKMRHNHLMVTHVPSFRYAKMDKGENYFFHDRNKVIISLCSATVITDVPPRGKEYILAKKAVEQHRPLILCKNVLDTAGASWAERYVREYGAIVADTPEYVQKVVSSVCRID